MKRLNSAYSKVSSAAAVCRYVVFAASLIAVQASAQPPGGLIWEDIVGSPGLGDLAQAIDARDDRVFAAGVVQSQQAGIAVRAYGARTGRLLWSARTGGSLDEVHAVHAFANVATVCVMTLVDDFPRFGVLAYDPATGNELWRDTGTNGDALACEGQQGRLYAVGDVLDEDTGADVLVRAYDASSGVMLWQDRFDGGGTVADVARAVAVRDGQVYVTGVVQQTPGNEDLFVRRYDGATGALVWHQLYVGPGGERDEGLTIVVANDRVLVGGFASQVAGAGGSVVLALRADTGVRLWADFHEGEVVNAIAARAGHVIAGSEGANAIVRAYAARSGRLEWARSEGIAGSRVVTVDTDDANAYWGAWLRISESESELFVQAVDIESGETAWENVRDNARPSELIVRDRSLFVAGLTELGGSTEDFLVRALRAP
jgi:outer membrane protein assembly factor BamB